MKKQTAKRFVKDWLWHEERSTEDRPWYDEYITDVAQMLIDFIEDPDRYKEQEDNDGNNGIKRSVT